MIRVWPILLLLGALQEIQSHRLDECLQAIRVKVALHRVELSIQVTPGVAVAERFLSVIDADEDGQITKAEEKQYGQKLLKELTLHLNEQTLALNLIEVSTPPLPEIKQGQGVVQIKASADFPPLPAGSHTLSLTNNHLPQISAYLVNAIRPGRGRIQLAKQSRDQSQRRYRLDFSVSSDPR